MNRHARRTVGLCCLLGAAAIHAAPGSSPAALHAELLLSAQRWDDKHRSDLARQVLGKLLAVEPDSAEGLVFLADLALRENQLEEARRILLTLQTRQPLHPATRELQQLVQVYSQQREKLARMRLTARAGRSAEAAVLAHELFPEGAPHYSAMGSEIARITGQPGNAALRTAATNAAPAYPIRPSRSAATRPATQRPVQTAAQASPDASASEDLASLNVNRASALRAQADEQLKAERLSPALRLLEESLQLTPDDAWLRYQLARLYLRLQLPLQARMVVDQGPANAPDDADMRYVRALTLAALDDDEAALAELQQVTPEERSAGMLALEQRLTVQLALAQATDPAQREANLRRAEDRAGNDAELLRQVANAWFRSGLPAQGTAVLQRRLERAPAAPAAVRLDYLQLLNRAGDDAHLSALLPALLEREGWSADERAALLEVELDHRERQIENALQAGDKATALASASLPLQAPADGAPSWRQQARLRQAAGDHSAAATLLEQALIQSPDDVDLHLAMGNARYQQGQMEEARNEAHWLQTRIDLADLERSLALLRLLQRSGDTAGANAQAQSLLQRYPDDVDVLLHSARLERSSGRYSDALVLFQRAAEQIALPADAPTLEKIEGEIQAIEARRQAWVEVGQLSLEKNSTDGLSSLRGWERPLVAWLPWGYAGKMFAHVDPVQLDAGSYAGSDPFAQPGAEAITRGVPQRADGVNIGVGYQSDDLRWDIGAIGLGFAVHNWVGGFRYSGNSGDGAAISYSLEASRRPLTGTLLSYAGTEDPISHAVWGGVVATGIGARLARDFGPINSPISASISASYALLTGQNVADNSRLKWRMAAKHDIYQSQAQLVNVGLSLSGLQHEKNLSGLTWGQGGYYSPQNNITLSVPVEWSGRVGRFTWELRGSVSVSDSSSSTSDFYPTNPAYQQQTGNPSYSGGSSSGSGWSYSGTAEYQLTPQLALGAQLAREVSDYYAPLNLLLYARFLLEPVRETLAPRPRPVQAYSQF